MVFIIHQTFSLACHGKCVKSSDNTPRLKLGISNDIPQLKFFYYSKVEFKDVISRGMSVLFLLEEKMTCTCPTMKAQEGVVRKR